MTKVIKWCWSIIQVNLLPDMEKLTVTKNSVVVSELSSLVRHSFIILMLHTLAKCRSVWFESQLLTTVSSLNPFVGSNVCGWIKSTAVVEHWINALLYVRPYTLPVLVYHETTYICITENNIDTILQFQFLMFVKMFDVRRKGKSWQPVRINSRASDSQATTSPHNLLTIFLSTAATS